MQAVVNERQSTTPTPTDEALVRRVVDGDATAFSLLYNRYERPVYTMAAHLLGEMEAEDVVQEAFLRLWRSAGQFDETRGRFAPWFMTISRHEVHARLRHHTRDQRLALARDIDQLLAEASDPTVDVENQAWQRERGDLVLRALYELPPEQRQVLVLAYFGQLSQSAIAQSLGWPLGTVKKRVRLGMQKLRTALTPHEVGPSESGCASSNGQVNVIRQRDRESVKDGL